MNHIELFSGCGGLNLGFEKANYELVFANELSPMASQTFAYNFFNEDLEKNAESNRLSKNVFWLASKHTDLKSRLRENPFEYPSFPNGFNDIPKDPNLLKGSLIVGNIVHLNEFLTKNNNYLEAIKSNFGRGHIDVISGGPPCQSFSLAGLRRKNCDKNTLPWEFAKFVEMISPRFALLENVSGILRAFKDNGVQYHAWFEVAKVFAQKGYIPLCLHVNARLVGIPQNRPRFIMLGIRQDIFESIENTLNPSEKELLELPLAFLRKVQANKKTSLDDLKYFDVSKSSDLLLFQNSFLHWLVEGESVSCSDAIRDIMILSKKKKSKYVTNLNNFFSEVIPVAKKLSNHEARINSLLVQRRFRIYQVIRDLELSTAKTIRSILKGEDRELSNDEWSSLVDKEFLSINSHKSIRFDKKSKFIEYLKAHPTKKQTQKALHEHRPAPATLSIPDDACHYHMDETRTLTVRELARIQSFPDGFVFKSKITTGGTQRRYEVPQYTQVGNAVPPLLGNALGMVLKEISTRI